MYCGPKRGDEDNIFMPQKMLAAIQEVSAFVIGVLLLHWEFHLDIYIAPSQPSIEELIYNWREHFFFIVIVDPMRISSSFLRRMDSCCIQWTYITVLKARMLLYYVKDIGCIHLFTSIRHEQKKNKWSTNILIFFWVLKLCNNHDNNKCENFNRIIIKNLILLNQRYLILVFCQDLHH